MSKSKSSLSPGEIKTQLETADNILEYMKKGKGFRTMKPQDIHKILERDYSAFRHAHSLVFDMICLRQYDKSLFSEYLHSEDKDRDVTYVVALKQKLQRLTNSQCRKLKRELILEKEKHRKDVADVIDYQRKLNIYREIQSESKDISIEHKDEKDGQTSDTEKEKLEKEKHKKYTETHSFLLARLTSIQQDS